MSNLKPTRVPVRQPNGKLGSGIRYKNSTPAANANMVLPPSRVEPPAAQSHGSDGRPNLRAFDQAIVDRVHQELLDVAAQHPSERTELDRRKLAVAREALPGVFGHDEHDDDEDDVPAWVWQPQDEEAQNPDTTPERLAELSLIDSDMVVDSIVGNPNTRTETLVSLSRRSAMAARAAARRSDCPPELLDDLVTSEHAGIRHAVATNPGTSAASLRKLAADDDRDVLEGVAFNRAAPVSALKKIFNGSGSRASTEAHRELKRRAAGA